MSLELFRTRRSQNAARAIILLLTLTLATMAFGQGIVTGSITGTVQDPQQAVIVGAKVTAIHQGTNTEFKTDTDSAGYFQIKQLPIGTYAVTIEYANFTKLHVDSVAVASGRTTALGTLLMKVGGATETVQVVETQQLVESTTSQVGGSFDVKKLQALPAANGGTFDQLALFIPGVAQPAASASNTNGAAISSNGLRGRSNNFQIDGQGNNDNSVAGPSIFLGNPDVLAEYQVVTNNFGAEYGRNTGTVINYVTKSGSNAFHGTAYEFYYGNWSYSHTNGEISPALGYCPKGVAVGSKTAFSNKCTAHQGIGKNVDNRFGGTFGGPIVKNKAWFFGSYQGERNPNTTNATTSSLTPTPDGLTALSAAFPNNPAVKALLAIGPYSVKTGNPQPLGSVQSLSVSDGTTTATIPFAGISRSVPYMYTDKQITGRGDWQISDKNRFFARYIFTSTISPVYSSLGVANGSWVDVPSRSQQIGLDYSRTWSTTFVQQFRFSYSRAKVPFEKGSAYPNCSGATATQCPTSIAFSDTGNTFASFGLGNNMPQDRLINVTQFQNNSTWMHGRHTIKFGAEYDRQRSPNHFLPNQNGTYTFTGNSAGSAFSHFLRGDNSTLSLTNGTPMLNFKEPDASIYIQDDFRIKDNLTLQFGMRWEFYGQAVNLLADISRKNLAAGLWKAGLPENVTTLPNTPSDLNNFGPNLGFAYTPKILPRLFGENKTVLRGGFRIAYDPAYYNIFLNVASAAPLVNAGTLSNKGVPATGLGADVQATFASQIPVGADPGGRNQTRITKDFHNPYTEQWSFGMERKINDKIALESRYVGNHTVGNFMTVNGNPMITGFPAAYLPAGVTACATAGAVGTGRMDCSFTNLRIRNNGAFSLYHGLQNELRIANYHNLTAGVQYTWSKGIDNVSEIFSGYTGINSPAPQNPFNPSRGERGVSAQSNPHVYTTYWVYDLPFMKAQKGVLGKVVGGWEWTGTYQWQIGSPITPYQSYSVAANAACDQGFTAAYISPYDPCRPILSNPNAPYNMVGTYSDATHMYAISNCVGTVGGATCPYVTPADVRFIVNSKNADNAVCNGDPFACTISRNTFRASNRNNSNMAVKKNFKLTERMNLDLRMDVYNVFNRQYMGTPGLAVTSRNINGVGSSGPAPGSFGTTALNTGTRRSIQLGARISF